MRRFLGTLPLLLALALLSGCGDDDGTAGGPDSPEQEPELVQMLVLTAAGGEVSPAAYFVEDRQDLQAYVRTFEDRDDVTAAVEQAIEDAGDRVGRLAAATVAIGCDVPEGVSITMGKDRPEVRADKITHPKQECFAPMTSIAVVEIP
jgi:hypothetical protein